MEFETAETIFYTVVIVVGFLAASARVVRDRDFDGFFNGLSIGATGGFFSFGVVCIFLRFDSSQITNPWFYVGVSALVGLLGKEQDYYLRLIMRKLLKAIGIENDEPH